MDNTLKPTIKISIVIPLYNVAGYAKKAADSIILQAGAVGSIEVVLVDDGSTDDSLEAYQKHLTGVKIVSVAQENLGLGAARNVGIKNATGDYIVFLDGDDFFLPNAFLNIIAALGSQKPDMLFGNYHLWTEKKGLVCAKPLNPPEDAKFYVNYILQKCPRQATRYICRRMFILEHNVFFETGMLCEDIKWSIDFLIALEKADGRISFLTEPFYAYNHRRPGSIMNTCTAKRILDLNKTVYSLLDIYKQEQGICKVLVWESFFYINEYCLFNKADRKQIIESYRRVMPKYRLSRSQVFSFAGKFQNSALFYFMSVGLFVAKMLRRAVLHIAWALKGKPRVKFTTYEMREAKGISAWKNH